MIATKRNFNLVNQITELLASNECTVKDATEILAYSAREIVANSKAQKSNITFSQED